MANQQLSDYIHLGLQQIAERQGFTPARFSIEFESGSEKGDGFAGKMVRAHIREDGREKLVVLTKQLPELQKRKSMLLFDREVAVYNEVLPAFRAFQIEKGLAEEEIFQCAPKCHFASCDMDKMEAVVIMEDLREKNFRMWNKFKPVDFDHCRLLMEQLGMLHAVSFAMKEQQPERFSYFKTLSDPLRVKIETDPMKTYNAIFEQLHERASWAIEDDDEHVKERFETLKGIVTETYIDCLNGEEAEPYAVIGHGDCWVNNMMYSYDGNESTPTDITLIDWQLCHYVSPILDLTYFIFICTDEEFRAKHFIELLDIYYKSISGHLKQLGGDAEKQFPREAFNAQWKKFGKFGLVMALIVLPMICTQKEDLPDMGKLLEKTEQDQQPEFEFATTGKALEVYRERIGGIIRDVVRLGYL